MPPKATYWSHFLIDCVTPTCLVGGGRNLMVSLGSKQDAKDKTKWLGEQQEGGGGLCYISGVSCNKRLAGKISGLIII